MTKLDLTATEPEGKTFAPFYGAFKGVIQDVETEAETDKNGATYYRVNAKVVYGEENYEKKFFGFLPFDWGDNSKPFGSLYGVLNTKWENLLINLEKETHKDVIVIIGAGRHWKTNEIKTYEDKNGKTRISYEVLGFAQYNANIKTVWTDEMEATEKANLEEINNSEGQLATPEDINF